MEEGKEKKKKERENIYFGQLLHGCPFGKSFGGLTHFLCSALPWLQHTTLNFGFFF